MSDVPMNKDVPFRALWPFLAIAFGLAWGIVGMFVVFPGTMVAVFGELTGDHPLFFLAVYAPAIAALILVARHQGRAGLATYLRRARMWRCGPQWIVLMVAGIPAIYYLAAAIQGTRPAEPLAFLATPGMLTALILTAVKGPVEEFGWRGLALPLLQRRLSPIRAALILGLIWGIWHLPAFVLSGTPQAGWSFLPFLAGSIAVSVIVTAMFNSTRGSILLPALFHFQLNNPVWPDAPPHDMALFVVAAIIVAWWQRRSLFARQGAVVSVAPARPVVDSKMTPE